MCVAPALAGSKYRASNLTLPALLICSFPSCCRSTNEGSVIVEIALAFQYSAYVHSWILPGASAITDIIFSLVWLKLPRSGDLVARGVSAPIKNAGAKRRRGSPLLIRVSRFGFLLLSLLFVAFSTLCPSPYGSPCHCMYSASSPQDLISRAFGKD